MPNPEDPPQEQDETCCDICNEAPNYSIVYCGGGALQYFPPPSVASTLAFDPQDGLKWVPVLAPQSKKPDAGEGA